MARGTARGRGKSPFVACHRVRNVLTPSPWGPSDGDNEKKASVCWVRECAGALERAALPVAESPGPVGGWTSPGAA